MHVQFEGCSEQRLDIINDTGRGPGRRVSSHHVAVTVDEELGEVPANVSATDRTVLSQVLPGRISGVTVHCHLFHDGELDAVLRLEGLDLRSVAGLLAAELIARVCNNFEALALEFIIDLN